MIAAAEAEARRRVTQRDRPRYLAALARVAGKVARNAQFEQEILDLAENMGLTIPGDAIDAQAQIVTDRVRQLCADAWSCIMADDEIEFVEERRANLVVTVAAIGSQPAAIYFAAARRALEAAVGIG